jgi:hypothetical protein
MSCNYPLEEMRTLLVRQRILMKEYGITNSDIYDIEYRLNDNERVFEMKKHDMNKDIKTYDIYVLTKRGKLKKTKFINSTSDYNHYLFNLHHYIEKQHYEENKQWFDERGIKQKLILLPVAMHEQLHGIAIKNLSDEEFRSHFKISKWDLIFSRKYSEY